MMCPKCGSNNVSVQMVSDFKLKTKHHSIIWWICIGWWWTFIKWICLFPLALIQKLFGSKKQTLKQKNYSMCVCQNCGHSWRA